MVEAFNREGGDITIEDMVPPSVEPSKIQQFFAGTTVFITGGTGFLGKLIMEKLLRTCPEIKRIYILMRVKKEKSIEKRFSEMFEDVFFDRIKREQPKFAEKIIVVSGDCILPNLGIGSGERQKLINEVNCVFHCAASVNFKEKIQKIAYINVRATRDLLRLAREMTQLKSFVYVSTAYSNCIRKEINEEFYEPAISGEKFLTLVDTLSGDTLDNIMPIVQGKWPNNYVFSKAVAEEVVKTEGKGLPVAVIRPSIIIATVNEPLAGWIDNVYGVTGIALGVALGLIRTLHCNPDCLADMVPADYVINCSIAAAWDIGTIKGSKMNKEISAAASEKSESDIPIYNYVCSTQKPITWREFMRHAEIKLKQIPSPLLVWHYCFVLNPHYFLHFLCAILLHKVPAYIIDFGARCIGKEPLLVKGYQKIDKFMSVITYFATQQWKFQNNNTQALWKKLNSEDRKFFEFDMDRFEWDSYFYSYARGIRVYLCKDPLDTLPQGWVKYRKLQIAHYTLVGLLLVGLLTLFMMMWNVLF